MRKIGCVTFIGIVLMSQTFLSAAPPMDEYKPKGGSPDLFRKEIDRPGAKDYLKMRKRQQLLEKVNKQLLKRGHPVKGLAQLDTETLTEAEALAKVGTDRVLIILVEFGGPDTFTWTPGVSTWDPFGKSDESEYTGKESDLGTPAACNNIITKYGITGPLDMKYEGPLHNGIERPASAADRSGDMIWAEDFSRKHFEDLIFGSGVVFQYTRQDGSVVDENFFGKSVSDYYRDMSDGVYSIVGDVVGWVKVPHSVWWYGADPCPGVNSGASVMRYGGIPQAGTAKTLVIDAIEAVKALGAPYNTADWWKQFDLDGDGVIDRLWIIHAGLGEEDSTALLNRTDYGEGGIWSHSSNLSPPYQIYPGINAWSYIVMPENSGIAVLAHEFGHNLGADDLYAYDEGETSAGFWTLMADDWTGYPIGFLPPAIDPWHLDNWGWLNPMVITDPNQVHAVTIGQASYFPEGPNLRRGVKIPLPDQILPLFVQPQGVYQWWGGLKDFTNSMMTTRLPVSIPSGGATLTFETAYGIGTRWDFLWVQVSEDGGTTWKTLTNDHTTCTHDPNWIGASFGFPDDLCAAGIGGFTGYNANFPQYGVETFDLQAFAGKGIHLRFWYMTDWGTLWEGPFIDDIRITAGGNVIFSDDAEAGDSNWNYAGAWDRNDGTYPFTHNYYLQWRNVSPTGGYDSALADPRWRYGPANTGLLVWYNNNRYSDNNIRYYLDDPPAFGPKGQMLVVDSHPEPYRDPYYVAMGFNNEAGNVHPRSLMRDAPISLWDTVEFIMKQTDPDRTGVYQETHFSGLPAVSLFSDSQGYYPGAEYVSRGPGYDPPVYQWITKQWDSSVVIPSKEFYGIKAPGYHTNDPFRFGCIKVLTGPDAGKASCYKVHAGQEGLDYDGGIGDPGETGGQYGWNVKIIHQQDSRAIVRIWNSLYTNPDDCTYTLSPANKSFLPEGGSTTTNVTVTGNLCGAPDIAASDSWITATVSSFSGTSGVVNVSVSPNASTIERIGIVAIGGQIFTLTQSAPQPNLIPYQPAGWSDKIVVSKTAGTNTDSSPIYATDNLYVNWSVINNGQVAVSTPFVTQLYVDGILKHEWTTNSLGVNQHVDTMDFSIGTLDAGEHTVGIVVDGPGAINESDEGDNTYDKTITVVQQPLEKPNLTPYQPPGWSDKIVVSKTTGTNTDSSPLYRTDALYVDWCVMNNGRTPASTFTVELYVDGWLKGSWTRSTPLGPNEQWKIEDHPIGSLDPGEDYLIDLYVDSEEQVGEADEGDNYYAKTITVVQQPLEKPNLTPYQPPGWSDKIVISKTTGTNTDSSPIFTTDTLYVDWSVINNGQAAVSTPFVTRLYVDGSLNHEWTTNSLGVNQHFDTVDFSIGTLGVGTHTVRIVADATGVISESDENDNSYEKVITVQQPLEKPNLTPYQPPGWSDKIVISRTTGTNTDSSPIFTTDTLYVDWSVINNGQVAVSIPFGTRLYVDGSLKNEWTTNSLGVNQHFDVLDFSIGTLSAGTHTVRMVVDATGAINESNENDNSYEKAITVQQPPEKPNLTPYQPPGWSDKIVVSKTAGSNTDSSPIFTTDTLYVDWSVINNGQVAVSTPFVTRLYVDGSLKNEWTTNSLGVNQHFETFDFPIGTLSAGTHTVRIAVDSTEAVNESDEGDNVYEKTIMVTTGILDGPDLTGKWVIAPIQTCKGTGAKQKCKLSGSLLVQNSGNRDIATPSYVDFYVEKELIARVSLAKLKAGGSKALKLKYSLPIGQSASGKHVKGKIDADNSINESNEENNEIVSEAIP